MRSMRRGASRRAGRNDGSLWLSFSDLMSSLLLIIILVLFYVMYQYFDMYEVNMAEIARRHYELDEANSSIAEQQETLDEQSTKLTAQEQEIIRQKQALETAEAGLEDAQALLDLQKSELADAQALLDAQKDELSDAQSLLEEKETEIAAQQETLDALSVQLGMQATQINEQQELLETQQQQIEQLVGLKTRIISSLSTALKSSRINATVDQTDGSIALESDVLFGTGEYQLTDAGKARIDQFLPVYLDVLFSDEYREYVAEIIIEGHTDSRGSYIANLQLSQQRANAVAVYVLSDAYTGITAEQREYLRKVATTNGRSWSDPVLVNGVEDMDASRRVVFKFRLTDETMIEQLKAILEETEYVEFEPIELPGENETNEQ